MSLRRWWRYRKVRKCRSDGHRPRTESREGFLRPSKVQGASSFLRGRSVAFSVTQKRTVCRRCGRTLSGWETVRQRSLTSISMPARMHDRLEEAGEVWIR